MPTLAIMKQTIEVLDDAFRELQKDTSLYLVPAITEIPCQRAFELQVTDGNVEYSDFDGGVRSENFVIEIGIMTKVGQTHSHKYHVHLSHLHESIWAIKERVIDALEGEFLIDTSDVQHLTRPLRVVKESPVYEGTKHDGLLIKRIAFLGGLNVLR